MSSHDRVGVRPLVCPKALGRVYGVNPTGTPRTRSALASWCAAAVLGAILAFACLSGPLLAEPGHPSKTSRVMNIGSSALVARPLIMKAKLPDRLP